MTNRDSSSTTTQHAGSAGGDPAYARPHKNRSPVGAATPASAVNMGSGGAAAHGDQLDSMLGSLQSDMNRQGVSTKTKGLCAACNKPVVSQMITALGKVWHVEHFTCAHCKMTLGTMSFYEREGKAYCEQDYHNLFAPRCAYCSGPITDKCVTALDKTWHPEHFFCGFCGCNFGDQGFHERDGQAYCREDFLKMFAPKCGGCGQPINDSYISALNRHWHPECFVCWDCQRPFGNMSFFDHDGLPYCEQHYHAKRGSLCADCQQPITGPSIIAMGRKFHPKHFTCAFCLKQLNNVTFKEQNNKPYCHPCFSKLFAGTKMMD
ncbi:PXN [Acanthosepion pharaonis]|uniref:PXN n=1 Tax=Acanthosepion pharaonis TaxID=158019 RepID=A0A812DW48_ACAPH|nr:PXN [Sepia pharaonis]